MTDSVPSGTGLLTQPTEAQRPQGRPRAPLQVSAGWSPMQAGAGRLQDTTGVKGEGEWGEASCEWLTAKGGPFSEDPAEEGLDVENCGIC